MKKARAILDDTDSYVPAQYFQSTSVPENTVERLGGTGGTEVIEVDQRGDKRSHIPNGSLYKCRIIRIQGVVTVHLLDRMPR